LFLGHELKGKEAEGDNEETDVITNYQEQLLPVDLESIQTTQDGDSCSRSGHQGGFNKQQIKPRTCDS